MKTKNLFLALASLLMIFAISFSSCTKNGTNGGDALQVYLTDGPGDFEAVNIDIQKVEVKLDKDEKQMKDDQFGDDDDDKDDHLKTKDGYGEWVTIKFTPGIVDVFKLRNGVEKILADGNVTGTVRKVRITLGSNNSVVKNGQTFPLVLNNITGSFLYIKLKNEHREKGTGNSLKVWIDFDIANSIVEINGKFYLKPVLRPFCNANFGEVEGIVLPKGIKATVTFSNGQGLNAVALPGYDGEFKIRGLKEGTYTATFAADGYKSQTKTVIVAKGKPTKIELVTLIK